MRTLVWALFAVLLLTTVSRAQETPQADVAVGYARLQILKGFTIPTNGASGSVAFNANDWLGVTADLGAYHSVSGISFSGETFAAGPRFSYRKGHWVTPFAQALVGGMHFSRSFGDAPGSAGSHFAFGGGAGADIALSRSGRIAFRPALDYFQFRANGSAIGSVRASIGLVYRIGTK